MMKILPLTVLVHDGPQARAYLARIRRAGWRPARILLMVWSRNPLSGKPLGRWLPRSLRRSYAEKAQEVSRNHWPRQIRARWPNLVESMTQELSQICAEASSLVAEMLGAFRWDHYAERVDRVLVEDLRDPALAAALSGPEPEAVLFTGGGILRDNLLGLEGRRFLHVHPGFLPNVRGADGLLWSILVRGRPGASCFYMERGIDTGEILAAEDFPPLRFELAERPDDQTLYRAVFSFCDPLLRAELLATRVLNAGEDLCRLPGRAQDPGADEGLTYHFLHPKLRHEALRQLFGSTTTGR